MDPKHSDSSSPVADLFPVDETVLSPKEELFGCKDLGEAIDKSDIPPHLQGYVVQLAVMADRYNLEICRVILREYLHVRMSQDARGWKGLTAIWLQKMQKGDSDDYPSIPRDDKGRF